MFISWNATARPSAGSHHQCPPQRPAQTGHPDGTQLAFVGRNEDLPHSSEQYVYVAHVDDGWLTNLGRTFTPPEWSPDGTQVAFVGWDGSERVVVSTTPNGSTSLNVTEVRDRPPYYAPAEYSKRIILHHTFPLPRKRAAKKKQQPKREHRKATVTQHKPTGKETAKQTRTKRTPEQRKEYERTRNQTPERKEYQRQLRRKQAQIAKETGKCKSCPQTAIPGQTRCETCAEKHRVKRRRNDAERRASQKAKRQPNNPS